MKITLIVVGKTTESYIQQTISEYEKRINFYLSFNILTIPELKNTKNLSNEVQKNKEGELILAETQSYDQIILLDDKGAQYTSVEFATFLEKKAILGIRKIAFVVGGPYGFSPEVYKAATGKLSLSKMTFSHQIIRPLFLEQLYRALTIINNTPYHHE